MGTASTVAVLVEAASRHMDPVLLPPDQAEDLRSLAGAFPLALTSLVGFEFRMQHLGPAGFFYHVARSARHVMAGYSGKTGGPYEEDVWDRLRDLAREWLVEGSPADRRLDSLTVEFDLPLNQPGIPVPFVFVSMNESGNVGATLGRAWWLDDVLPVLFGRAVPAALEALVGRCVAALPGGAFIGHVGVAFGRDPQPVRLNVGGLSSAQILPYLDRIGWPAQGPGAEHVTCVLDRFLPAVDAVTLCLDLTNRLESRIGLECALSARRSAQPGEWGALLELLTGLGCASPGAVRALLEFLGTSTPASEEPHHWIPALAQAERLMDGRYRSVIERGLSHVKLGVVPEGLLEPKAYAFATYGWRRPTTGGRP